MRQRSAVRLIAMVGVVGALGAGAAGQASQGSQGARVSQAPKGARPAPAAPKPRAPGDVEVEPIACWWKTDRNAVHVGERFTVTLTCSIIETAAIKVVPDLNQLEPTTVALQPFEVVNGIRHTRPSSPAGDTRPAPRQEAA